MANTGVAKVSKQLISFINTFVKQGELQHALALYKKSQGVLRYLTRSSILGLLKAAIWANDVDTCSFIHHQICDKQFLSNDPFMASALVKLYGKHGDLAKAQEVFKKILMPDVVLWTALMSSYMECGKGEDVLHCFAEMRRCGISPNEYSHCCALKAGGSIGSVDKIAELYIEITMQGFECEIVVGSTLVDAYARCSLLSTAEYVLQRLPVKTHVSWTSLISGYAEHGYAEQALDLFDEMECDNVCADSVSYICALKACSSCGSLSKGQMIHTDVTMKGLEHELLLGSALVDMYAKSGSLLEAQRVFDKLPIRDTVSWNALIAGYVQSQHVEHGLMCAELMQLDSVSPDIITFVYALKASCSTNATVKIQELHSEIISKGLEGDLLISNTLVDIYAQTNLLKEAQQTFDKLIVQQEVSITSLMAGYNKHGDADEALRLYDCLQENGIHVNDVAFVCGLKSCCGAGVLIKGREIHNHIVKNGLETENVTSNALVDMYSKNGCLMEAEYVFDKLMDPDIVSWNAVLNAFSQFGDSNKVFKMFRNLLSEGVQPDLVTFSSVLKTCSHSASVNEGFIFFKYFTDCNCLIPSLEHYTCLADVLGRAGHVFEAALIIMKMPVHPSSLVWHAALGACQKWRDVELGKLAFQHALQLDENDLGAHICLSNISLQYC